MPSFDIVSKVDMGELKNAILQAQKEMATRFDFKGSNASLELKTDSVVILAEDESKMKSALDILRTKMAKRNVGMRTLDPGPVEPTGNRQWKQVLQLKQGVDKEQGKLLNRLIKESGLKVTSSYMDEKIRVQGKKIDDLQTLWQHLRNHKEVVIELQMENMKRE